MRRLRLLTYLAPSLPEELFALVAQALGARTGIPTILELETQVSGPTAGTDPFVTDRADLAFVCGPSFPELRAAGSPVEVLAAALVFDDPRADDRPVYFSDVVVPRDHPSRTFADLVGAVWAYNDRFSLSGWYKMLTRLTEVGHPGPPETFFLHLVHSGSHLGSIALVAGGGADAAAVDSNALRLELRRESKLWRLLRVLESWGPSPIQPLLSRSTLAPDLKAAIIETLLALHTDATARRALDRLGVRRFATVEPEVYATLSSPGWSIANGQSRM